MQIPRTRSTADLLRLGSSRLFLRLHYNITPPQMTLAVAVVGNGWGMAVVP